MILNYNVLLGFAFVAFYTVAVGTIVKAVQIDSSANEKVFHSVIWTAAPAGLLGAGLMYNQFSNTPQFAIHFITAIVMLVFLPATLISLATMTVTASNAPSPL